MIQRAITLLLLGAFLAPLNAQESHSETESETKRILFLAGKRSHGPGAHEHRAGSLLLAKSLNESGLPIQADVINIWPEDPAMLDEIDAAVIYADAGGRYQAEQYALLDEKVKAGMGIMFIHYGVHPKKETGEQYFLPWMGGFFEDDWSVNPHWTADLTPKAGHPISNGIDEPILANDEFYYNMRFPAGGSCDECYHLVDSYLDPKRITRYNNLWNQHGDRLIGKRVKLMWCRDSETQGRGVGFTGGHFHRNWAIDDFRKVVLNAIAWAARVDVPADGVPSAPITDEQLNQNLDGVPKVPLTRPTRESILAMEPMLRPRDPENYVQKEHYEWVREIKEKGEAAADEINLEAESPSAYEWIEEDDFVLPDDLELTLWAKSPDLHNPTNMDMDAHGRMWVAEGVNYRRYHRNMRSPNGDRIVVLQDTNRDGKVDKSHTFVQEEALVAPLGVTVFGNRILVAQPPELIVYTDVDENLVFDPKIDKREILLTGFNGWNHDHSLHAVIAGPSGKWYINQGNCGAEVTDRSGQTFRVGSAYVGGKNDMWPADTVRISGTKSDDGHVWVGGFIGRMNPDGTDLEIIGHGIRNAYEHTVNSLGEIFHSDNDDPPACRNSYLLEYGNAGFFSHNGKVSWETDRRPGQSIPVAHWRQEDPGFMPPGDVYGSGSPTGVAFYENGALPEKYNGMYLAAEARIREIFSYFPKPDGAGYELNRNTLLGVKENGFSAKFRPSDVEIGPDGALYICDWYDPGVGGHNTRDDAWSGAIYRLAPKGFKVPELKPDTESLAGLIKLLRSPSDNVRFLAVEALKQMGEAIIPDLKEVMADPNPWIAARPIWILPHLGKKGVKECERLLKSENASTRMVAYKALRRAGREMLPYAKRLAADPSGAVRREVATSLRNHPYKAKEAILAKGYELWDGEDRTYLEVLGLSLTYDEAKFWKRIENSRTPGPWSPKFTWLTWRLHPEEAIPQLMERASDPELTEAERKFAIDTIAFVPGKAGPQAMLHLYLKEPPEQAYAEMWFDMNLDGNKWDGLIDRNLVAEKVGIVKPGKAIPYEHPAPPSKRSTPSADAILALQGDAHKGEAAAMRCIMCHDIGGKGASFGPSLVGWAKSRTREDVLDAIINPDAGIAHGYDASRVLLKNDQVVDGLVKSGAERAWHFVNIADADSYLIMTTPGGVEQKISWKEIRRVEPNERSLMLYPESLGLTDAQEIADLVAYLQELN